MKIGNITIEEERDYRAAVCKIGPKEAAELLKRNTKNRKISQSKVERLAREMDSGEWYANSDGVGIDTQGVLTNGQHTLLGVVKSGKTIPLLVVTGLLPMAREKADRNRTRSLFDNLFLSGECDSRRKVEVAKFLSSAQLSGKAQADVDVKSALQVHREAIDATAPLFRCNSKGLTQAGVRAAIVLAYEIHGKKALEFCEKLLSDLHDRADEPAFRLRKVLLGDSTSRPAGKGGGQQSWAFKKTVAAFNAFVKGERILRLYDEDEIVSA